MAYLCILYCWIVVQLDSSASAVTRPGAEAETRGAGRDLCRRVERKCQTQIGARRSDCFASCFAISECATIPEQTRPIMLPLLALKCGPSSVSEGTRTINYAFALWPCGLLTFGALGPSSHEQIIHTQTDPTTS